MSMAGITAGSRARLSADGMGAADEESGTKLSYTSKLRYEAGPEVRHETTEQGPASVIHPKAHHKLAGGQVQPLLRDRRGDEDVELAADETVQRLHLCLRHGLRRIGLNSTLRTAG